MARGKRTHRRYYAQIINVTLKSNRRSGDAAYTDMMQAIHTNKISIPVNGTTNVILRTQFSDVADINGRRIEYLYGKISKYTVINGDDWINMSSMEVESVELPPHRFPNLKETDYIFIPSAHRMVIVNNRTVSINHSRKFLENAIKEVINADEQHEVFIVQSEDIFERITNASAIQKLLIDISYSNADTGDEAYEFIDSQLRDSKARRMKMEITPDHNESVNTESTLIQGSLRVAQSNGYVQATIVENGERIKIDTKEHPRVISLIGEEATLKQRLISAVLDIFRPLANE